MSRDRQDFDKEWSVVRLRVAASVATITLNRPDRLNALTADMCDELVEALDEANDHD
ncbi:enoyl-CoA hydratase/isomerase family protein, partial [Algoriphagus aestuarii]|nr:enoyl-CoA hydratase/isomerase family protein [Algoriphagus aestuarii]